MFPAVSSSYSELVRIANPATTPDNSDTSIDMVATLENALLKIQAGSRLSDFVDVGALNPFRAFDIATAFNLLRDFYMPRDAGYELNFALMSKHALSRIYEKYVAIFQSNDSEDGVD